MVKFKLSRFSSRKIKNNSIVAHFKDGLQNSYTKDDTIINGIDEPNGVFLIKSGFVKAYSIASDGQSKLLSIHEAGELIPLPWALDGAHTTGVYYTAMTDVTVLRVPKDKLRSAMTKNRWLFQEILKQAVSVITVYTQRIQTLENRSARERVIAELIYLAERFGEQQAGATIISVPLTHQDIADCTNMTRETASRAIESLSKKALINQKDHLFIILDLARLQAELEYS